MLIRGDALHLPLRDQSVDAVVCDPPYVDQLDMFGVTLATIPQHEGFTEDENILCWTRDWGKELFRVLRPAGSAFVLSSARTFPLLASGLPPIVLGVSGDGDITRHFSPAPYDGGLEMAGFTFHASSSWTTAGW